METKGTCMKLIFLVSVVFLVTGCAKLLPEVIEDVEKIIEEEANGETDSP